MRVAVVLGAGGAAGWVFHAGVVDGICQVTGHDVAQADQLIGTSAGAAVAASLRAGTSTAEFVAEVARPPNEAERAEMRAHMGSTRRGIRRFLPLAPGLVRHALPGGRGIGLAAGGLLPSGVFPTVGLRRFPGVEGFGTWPDRLWVTATRVPDGERVVFGRDRTDVAVATALEASSAVPGMFRPRQIGGERYVDGAVVSPTHADLAIGAEPDLVVISAVMSRPGRRPFRVAARRRLAEEVARLDAAGIRSLVIEPDAATGELFTGFPRRHRESGRIVDAARALTVERLTTVRAPV